MLFPEFFISYLDSLFSWAPSNLTSWYFENYPVFTLARTITWDDNFTGNNPLIISKKIIIPGNPMRNLKILFDELKAEYSSHSPLSENLNDRAKKCMVDGGNHSVRLMLPFPPRIKGSRGAKIVDEDGHKIIDFWQGHYANLLGHNPEIITSALSSAFARGFGLQSGFTDQLQIETAEILCRQSGAERVRFTTSGALATMYSVMMSRAFTRRDLVMKVSGGWHGGHPWGLKGVKYEKVTGFDHLEGEGIPPTIGNEILQTSFNDCQMLQDHFRDFGDRLACFILEPVVGSGGFIPATKEYLQTARSLADQYGVILVFDEVIAGFRFRAGNIGKLYGVQPDLATFGKIMGGGMPVAAVAGNKEIMEMAGSSSGMRVRFSGGTYSAHPASMLAAKTMMNYLVEHEQEIYPRVAELGILARQLFTSAFIAEGIHALSTGYNQDLQESSLFILHFPVFPDQKISKAEDANNPELCDTFLSKEVVKLGLLLQDVNMIDGKGAVSYAHNEADLQKVAQACQWLARRIKQSV